MSVTRIFSVYDDSGEKAVVSLTAENVKLENRNTIALCDENGDSVCQLIHYGFYRREVK
jgi:hypothetical protein